MYYSLYTLLLSALLLSAFSLCLLPSLSTRFPGLQHPVPHPLRKWRRQSGSDLPHHSHSPPPRRRNRRNRRRRRRRRGYGYGYGGQGVSFGGEIAANGVFGEGVCHHVGGGGGGDPPPQ